MATFNSLQTSAAGIIIFGNTPMIGGNTATVGWTNTSKSLNDIGASSYLRGINLGGLVCINGCGGSGIPLMYEVTQSMVEGSPSPPSIMFSHANMWRFKWSVAAGARNISIKCKQVCNESPRPSVTVESNVGIGVMSDVSATAASGVDWVTIGPISITPTSAGAVWVKMYNNLNNNSITNTPAYFDHIVVT